jgi:hypothetical protein
MAGEYESPNHELYLDVSCQKCIKFSSEFQEIEIIISNKAGVTTEYTGQKPKLNLQAI